MYATFWMSIKPEDVRGRVVMFRLSKGEYAEVELAASSARSISDWLRETVLERARGAAKEDKNGREGSARKD